MGVVGLWLLSIAFCRKDGHVAIAVALEFVTAVSVADMVFDANNSSSGFGGLLYIAVVVWSLLESSKRLMTAVWIVVSLFLTLGVFFVMSLIWPELAGVLGHVAAIVCFLVSALVGLNYMRAHRRPSIPKP